MFGLAQLKLVNYYFRLFFFLRVANEAVLLSVAVVC